MSIEEGSAQQAVVTSLDERPVITTRGGAMRFLSTPAATGAEHSIFGHLVLQPGESVAEHVHDYGEETLFVLEGNPILRAGGEEHHLRAGDCIFLPRGVPHGVTVAGEQPVVAVFATAPPAPRPDVGHRDVRRD